MKRFRFLRLAAFCAAALSICIIGVACGEASIDCAVWFAAFEGDFLPEDSAHVLASLGEPDSLDFDELLSADVAEYKFGESSGRNRCGAAAGRFYSSGGVPEGFSTIYEPGYRSRIGRFVLDHFGEILFLGEMSAVAKVSGDCGKKVFYSVISITAESEAVYFISQELYASMVSVGDLPPIPERGGRKGYAA